MTTTIGITLGSGMVIAAVVNFLKAYLEMALKPDDPRHDVTVQILALLTGAVGFIAHAASLAPLTGPILWDNAGQGALAGLSAIATFHILTGTVPALPGKGATVTVGQIVDVPPADPNAPKP